MVPFPRRGWLKYIKAEDKGVEGYMIKWHLEYIRSFPNFLIHYPFL